MSDKPTDRCPECSAEFKTKYLIRREADRTDPKAKTFYESTTRRSVVGWVKLICNEFPFETITIYNLLTECRGHEEYWKQKVKA